jgi:hypothetical protein
MSDLLQVFSSGGGTQSAAIAALIVQGRLPKPDFCVIADTGYEMPTTWNYWHGVIVPELAKVGVKAERIPLEFQSVPAHGRDWQSHNENTILLPMFSNQSGGKGKLKGFCSSRWKVEVVDRYLRRTHGIKRSQYCKWIGFSFDEQKRIAAMMQGEEYKRGLIRFPLAQAQDAIMRRHDSAALLFEMGWPEAPRSRCFMCPNQSDWEWREVKQDYPEYFQKAVDLERQILSVDHHAFMHQSCKPLDEVDFTQDDLFSSGAQCSTGMCFV